MMFIFDNFRFLLSVNKIKFLEFEIMKQKHEKHDEFWILMFFEYFMRMKSKLLSKQIYRSMSIFILNSIHFSTNELNHSIVNILSFVK
jgi:hypothetical protein